MQATELTEAERSDAPFIALARLLGQLAAREHLEAQAARTRPDASRGDLAVHGLGKAGKS